MNWIRNHIALSVVIGIVALAVIVGIVLLARLCINKYRSESRKNLDEIYDTSSNIGIKKLNSFYFNENITYMMPATRRGEYDQPIYLYQQYLNYLGWNVGKKWVMTDKTIDEVAINSVKDCVKNWMKKDFEDGMTITDFQEFMIELINLDNSYGNYLRGRYRKENYYWSMEEIEKNRDLSANPSQLLTPKK